MGNRAARASSPPSAPLRRLAKGDDAAFRQRYRLGAVVGHGVNSVVKQGEDLATGAAVAVKILEKRHCGKEEAENLRNEVDILHELQGSANIIKMFGFYEDDKHYFLVTELCKGGELFDRVVLKEFYSERDAQSVVRILALALKCCHDKGIVHRDLKPENILLREDDAIVLADFGFARRGGAGLTEPCGTPGFVAPEIINGQTYGAMVDIWSLGVVVFILLCGYPPFFNSNQAHLFSQIRRGDFKFESPFWDPISVQAKDFVAGCLTVDPAKRLTVEQVLNHPWMHLGEDAQARERDPVYNQMEKFNLNNPLRAVREGV